MSELAQLMEEPAGGSNHGSRLSDNPALEGSHVPLDVGRWQRNEFLRGNGWTFVHSHDGGRAGLNSHAVNQYTVLHPDDYVNEETLAALVEDELGFTVEQLHSVYCTGGRIPSSRQELRDVIDARLLDLVRGGANMDLFGRLMGLNGSTVDRALARARSQEGN
jgi:hypothetical protein